MLDRNDPIALRYGKQPAPHPDIPLNPVLETILTHRSLRRLSDRALPAGTLELLVAAAQSAPSSSNLQAMSIVAVEDKARQARLAVFANNQKQVADAPLLLLFVADLARLRAVSALAGEAGAALDYLEMLLVAVGDAAFAAQNVFIAMESLGLGGCYIGAMRNHPREVAAEIGLPPGAFVAFGLTVGYPDPSVTTDVKPRLAQSVVLHRERYQAPDPADLAAYDAAQLGFRYSQGMSDTGWTQQAAARVAGPGSMSGRHALRETLRSMGLAAE